MSNNISHEISIICLGVMSLDTYTKVPNAQIAFQPHFLLASCLSVNESREVFAQTNILDTALNPLGPQALASVKMRIKTCSYLVTRSSST